jgi:hypothetical protein
LLVLLRSASSIFDAAIALAETLQGRSHHSSYGWAGVEVAGAVQQLATAASGMAMAIAQGHQGVNLQALDQAMAAVDDQLTGRQQVSETSTPEPAKVCDLQGIARALQVVARQIHSAADGLARVDRPSITTLDAEVRRQTWPARLDVITSRLRDNLTIRSLIFRHALRPGVTATAAAALPPLLGLLHGTWVALTAMVILKPNCGGIYQQAKLRGRNLILGFEPCTEALEAILRALATTVRRGHLLIGSSGCDASLGTAQPFIRQLTDAAVVKAATEPLKKPKDDAMPGIVALRAELDRLADEVVGMARALTPGQQPHGGRG